MHLKCSVCKRRPKEATAEFDDLLLRESKAVCPRCAEDPAVTTPGLLLPDIVLDDKATGLWAGREQLKKLLFTDGNCDVLLLLGPRLRSHGAARVVQALAERVHSLGGSVIYIDWKTLPPNIWGRYVDLHIEADVDAWAENYLENLSQLTARSMARSSIKHKIFEVVGDLRRLRVAVADRSQPSKREASEIEEEPVRPKKKVKFASEPRENGGCKPLL
ncbi:hypothetical protein FRC08_005085 [Ceratobasidium sp. 394]|nr:hypothetical protein FRC08_005085 [Ceratobasidium sp. 394]KAG9098665.1 hypothetical protein FS749_003289 [Ceratobasidium sp. UAMH 11750]